jgi:hypothetical protein
MASPAPGAPVGGWHGNGNGHREVSVVHDAEESGVQIRHMGCTVHLSS